MSVSGQKLTAQQPDPVSLQTLRRSRSRHKANVTKKINEIKALQEGGVDPQMVKAKLTDLDQAWKRFLESHNVYHEALIDDEDETADSRVYVDLVRRDVSD